MKKIIVTLLLVVIVVPQLFAETGTVTLSYENGAVSYNDTQTFYEFDVMAYIASGSGSNIFQEGMVYVEYDTTIFGSNIVGSNKLTLIDLRGPLAALAGPVELYTFANTGADTYADVFALTFEAIDNYASGYYGSDAYVTNQSGSPDTLMHIKMEVAASGTSTVDWPSSITGINNLYRELNGSTTYDALSITNATETTAIVYSNTGDPALPISLREFSVQYIDEGVSLTWITESEAQNLGYVLKRAIKYSEDDLSPYDVIASYQTDDELYGAGTTTEQNTYAYIDKNVKPGISYSYILEDVDYDGNVIAHTPVSILIPENVLYTNEDFNLGSSYPNPFNPSFTIPFELNKTMDVSIKMYDITGKQVMSILDGTFEARQYQFRVNASDLNSGIYFMRTIIGSEIITQKMTLLK